MKKPLYQSFFCGITIFILQLLCILVLCPEKTWLQAWLSLASHWDSEWYAAIAAHGYINTDGPSHSGLLNANVVFFPGYPYLARLLVISLHLDAKVALLLVAQTATLLFWCFLFYILRSLSWTVQWCAACLILAFPTSWFLFMGYSESVFILCMCVMLWSLSEKRWFFLSSLWGIGMTATRLIGLPVLAAPLCAALMVNYTSLRAVAKQSRSGLQLKIGLNYYTLFAKTILKAPSLLIMIGSLGCLGFLVYCAMHFGSWHLYFDMERIHWKGTADPLFLLKAPTWLPPPWGFSIDLAPVLPNPWGKIFTADLYRLAAYTLSESMVPILLWLQLFFGLRLVKQRKYLNEKTLVWYIASFLVFLFSCYSLSTRYYESMSRCLLPVWILLIISDAMNGRHSFFFGSKSYFKKGLFWLIIGFSGGLWVQLLNRFFLGWWVA